MSWRCPWRILRRAGWATPVARVRELEHIRQFLTSNSVTVVLDVLFAAVFLRRHVVLQPDPDAGRHGLPAALCDPVCGHYAAIRARLNEKFNRGAENQSFLVEAISGIQTVKALAVEPPSAAPMG